jgi:hypothetical protein
VVNPSIIIDEDENDWVDNSMNNMKIKKKMNKYRIKFENIYVKFYLDTALYNNYKYFIICYNYFK